MTTIQRRNPDAVEEIEVPEGHVPCPACEGRGYTTKYEQGWSSLAHSPSLAAPEQCFTCHGDGYISEPLAEFMASRRF